MHIFNNSQEKSFSLIHIEYFIPHKHSVLESKVILRTVNARNVLEKLLLSLTKILQYPQNQIFFPLLFLY